jgi:hypothetical protein
VPAADVDLGPAQARDVLGTEHEIEPAAERIAVDQQRPAAVAHRRDRERGGEDRGTCPAATAHDGDGGASAVPDRDGFHRLGEQADQPELAVRQGHDVRGADGDGVPPDLRRRLGPDDDEHVAAARKACLATAKGGVLVEQDDR